MYDEIKVDLKAKDINVSDYSMMCGVLIRMQK